MTRDQKNVIEEFCEKFGGVNVIDIEGMIQLQLDKDMIIMEGLSLSWLKRFEKYFYGISIGIPQYEVSYGMYITLFKSDHNGHVIY